MKSLGEERSYVNEGYWSPVGVWDKIFQVYISRGVPACNNEYEK